MCDKAPARSERKFMHRCKPCVQDGTDRAIQQLLEEEAYAWLQHEASKPEQRVEGTEPALQHLLVPTPLADRLSRPANGPMPPAYADTPQPLHPRHCRLCLRRVTENCTAPPPTVDVHATDGGDAVQAEDVCVPDAVPTQPPPEDWPMSDVGTAASQAELLDVETADAFFDPEPADGCAAEPGPEVEEVSDPAKPHLCPAKAAQDSELTRHLRAAGWSPSQYREAVLEDALHQWPQRIQPQLLRARLAGYKAKLTDANYRLEACACCAREKRRVKLQEVVFPPPNAPDCPPWLPYTAEEWAKHGETWHTQVDDLFNLSLIHI